MASLAFCYCLRHGVDTAVVEGLHFRVDARLAEQTKSLACITCTLGPYAPISLNFPLHARSTSWVSLKGAKLQQVGRVKCSNLQTLISKLHETALGFMLRTCMIPIEDNTSTNIKIHN